MTPQEEGSQVTGQRSPEVTPSRPLCDSFTQQIPLVHLLCVNCFNLGDPGEPDNQRTHVSERGAVQGPGWHGPSPRGGGACRTAARAAPGSPPAGRTSSPCRLGAAKSGLRAPFRNVCGCLWQDTPGASGRTPDTETHSPRAHTCGPTAQRRLRGRKERARGTVRSVGWGLGSAAAPGACEGLRVAFSRKAPGLRGQELVDVTGKP